MRRVKVLGRGRIGLLVLIIGVVLVLFSGPLASGIVSMSTNIGLSSPPELDNVEIGSGEEKTFDFTTYNHTDENVVMSVGVTDTLSNYTDVPEDFQVPERGSHEFSLSFSFDNAGFYDGLVTIAAHPSENEADGDAVVIASVATSANFYVGDVDEVDLPENEEVLDERVEENFVWGGGGDDFGVTESTGNSEGMVRNLFLLTGLGFIGFGAVLMFSGREGIFG